MWAAAGVAVIAVVVTGIVVLDRPDIRRPSRRPPPTMHSYSYLLMYDGTQSALIGYSFGQLPNVFGSTVMDQ
jgi:hypothetical protein